MVKSGNSEVLAIGDLTFLVPPQDSILDNDRLISNIADFLTTGQRRFDLSDFPYFFQDEVEILLGSSALIGQGTAAKALLTGFQRNSRIVGAEDITQDTLYLGLYQHASDVAQYLEVAGIRVGDSLRSHLSWIWTRRIPASCSSTRAWTERFSLSWVTRKIPSLTWWNSLRPASFRLGWSAIL